MTGHECGCGHSHEHEEYNEHSGCGEKYEKFKSQEGCLCEEKFLMLADEAWREYLKDRIKAKIAEKKGEHMENLAELIATANGERWKHKIMAKMRCHDFKEKLKDFFGSCGEQ